MPDGKGVPFGPIPGLQARRRIWRRPGVCLVAATSQACQCWLTEIDAGIGEYATKVAKTFHIHRLIPGNDIDSVINLPINLDYKTVKYFQRNFSQRLWRTGARYFPEGEIYSGARHADRAAFRYLVQPVFLRVAAHDQQATRG